MPRLMSVAFTEQAVRDRIKTVTRRKGWQVLKPGDRLTLCRKVMGRKPGEPLVRIAEVEVVDVRRERLAEITADEVALEGFPGMSRFTFDERHVVDHRGVRGAIAAADDRNGRQDHEGHAVHRGDGHAHPGVHGRGAAPRRARWCYAMTEAQRDIARMIDESYRERCGQPIFDQQWLSDVAAAVAALVAEPERANPLGGGHPRGGDIDEPVPERANRPSGVDRIALAHAATDMFGALRDATKRWSDFVDQVFAEDAAERTNRPGDQPDLREQIAEAIEKWRCTGAEMPAPAEWNRIVRERDEARSALEEALGQLDIIRFALGDPAGGGPEPLPDWERELLEQQAAEASSAPRTWTVHIPDEPPIGTSVLDYDGDAWVRVGNGWDPLGWTHDSMSWERLVGYFGPLTARSGRPSGGESQ